MSSTADALLARRNRARIVVLMLLAMVNYWLAVCAAAVAIGLVILFWVIGEGGFFDFSREFLLALLVAAAVIVVLSIVIGTIVAVVRLPFQRSALERRVLRETGAQLAGPTDHPRVRNLLEGLAIAADVPAPRFAVIEDPAPNSFGVGTRPARTIVGITTGLVERLSRDELEAILAYEVSRIRSWDIALASWRVALTGGAIAALDDDLKRIIGWLPLRFATWLQVWAVRGQAVERDRAAVRFTRNPAALVRALERLDADPSQVGRVSAVTAPLWVEVPAAALDHATGRSSKRLAGELLLDERIARTRSLAGLPVTST